MQLNTMGGGNCYRMPRRRYLQAKTGLLCLLFISSILQAEALKAEHKLGEDGPVLSNTRGEDLRVQHGRGGHHHRGKRDVSSPQKPGSKLPQTTKVIQYNGWHPLNSNNPLNNEPTVSYKPPPLQKVHIGRDPPSSKPLYPIVPKNPTVYVVRKEKSNPEIDEVYGTEKVEYVHIEPKSKTIRGFKPQGSKTVLKFVRRLDNVKSSSPNKRSHDDPNDFFLPLQTGPNFDISNFNFNGSSFYDPDHPVDLDTAFSETNSERVASNPFLRIIPVGRQASQSTNEAQSRGISPSRITPQQLLQARLHLARLPLLSPLHGLFGSFTQIPLQSTPRTVFTDNGNSAFREVKAPLLRFPLEEGGDHKPAESIRSVIFTRSQDIDRSDSIDYLNDRVSIVPRKSRISNRRLKNKKPSKSITAGSLSELLQIFKHINVTEPPPTPPTTPPPVTIMKGFRYTKPTEAPPTTTTTRPTTTKRFRLPTAFRYVYTKRPNEFIQNIHPFTTTTVRPLTPGKITIAPVKRGPKPLRRGPNIVYDRVAETNSLDGYLFSDSEASPDFTRSETTSKVVRKISNNEIFKFPSSKSLASKRVSIKLIGNEKEKDEIIHEKNTQPLNNDFEVIYANNPPPAATTTTTIRPRTTTIKTSTTTDMNEPNFAIIEGHSKVRVSRPQDYMNDEKNSIPESKQSSKIKETATSSELNVNEDENPFISDEEHSAQYLPETDIFANLRLLTEQDYESDYHEGINPLSILDSKPSRDYEAVYEDGPSYSIQKPWLLSEERDSNPANRVSLQKIPTVGLFETGLVGRSVSSTSPHLHFLETLHKTSMPTSAVPTTTWQDISSTAPANAVTKVPNITRPPSRESDAVKTSETTGDASDSEQVHTLDQSLNTDSSTSS